MRFFKPPVRNLVFPVRRCSELEIWRGPARSTLQFSRTALHRSGKSACFSGFGGVRFAIFGQSPCSRPGPGLGSAPRATPFWGNPHALIRSGCPSPIGTWGLGWGLRNPWQSPRSPRRGLTADRAGTWGFLGLGEQSRTPKGTRTWGKGSFLSRKRSTAHENVGVGPSGPTDAVPSRDRNVGFTSLPSGGQLSALSAFPRGRRSKVGRPSQG